MSTSDVILCSCLHHLYTSYAFPFSSCCLLLTIRPSTMNPFTRVLTYTCVCFCVCVAVYVHGPSLPSPAARLPVLQVVLHTAVYAEDDDTRSKAVRLTANKLVELPVVAPAIVDFGVQEFQKVCGAHHTRRQQPQRPDCAVRRLCTTCGIVLTALLRAVACFCSLLSLMWCCYWCFAPAANCVN